MTWHVVTKPGLIPPFVFEYDQQAAFCFGEPLKIANRIGAWFVTNADIYQHLWVTLVETLLAFGIGTALGLGCGLWLALSPMAAAIADPLHQGAELDAWRDPGANLRGVGLAFVGAVVGDYLGSSRGVGYLNLQAEGAFDINTVMAGILVLTVFALLLDAAVGKLERRLMKWQPRAGESEKL